MAPRVIDQRIKLRHLTCFWEVARLRSVGKAADFLNISQPAVSKTIKELEDILSQALFDRTRRRLTLSPFGEVFYGYAATSIAALRQGIAAAQHEVQRPILRIGALPTVSAQILPETVKALGAAHPGLRMRILTGPNDYLLGLLRTGDADLMIGRMARPAQMLGLSFEHLYFEQVVMAVRPGHPLLAEQGFEIAMIEPYQLMLPTPDSLIRRLVDQMLMANGVTEPRDEIETISNAFGRAYVMQSDAIWLISEGVVKRDLAAGTLAALPADMVDTMGPVGFTTRTDALPNFEAQLFMQAVRAAAAQLRG
ncbi:transcriptional regulator, LysR family (plasmid) [Ketogulonicigenium vulgare Y25]|uniref:Pca operon transcription factor PcaQ n=1 Tax=Ketogulonicigenium vulgare (strain WSH-001) TaxID=759362 RepID=F9YBX7_KETVW|nr:pca operon transcription factor PcaQ [Ketogulonicigenium vulgare]ADO44226.1 transcriptional regulator, LysR family [Ketogulonicigenium vulgare Y25]AEM42879.1 Pca operon transcription factor PcaQ [Ketogulonicigenium vulgare WSH-001]ALJ82695.1 LysR family transcriptional regulator [Ketogulonicigenium vulgare]